VFDGGAVHRNPVSLFATARRGEVVNKLLGFDLPRIFHTTDHHVEGVLFNTLHADGLAALARLARGRDSSLEAWARTEARRTTEALLDRCWDERAGLFFGLAGRSERRARRRSVVSLAPLLLPDLPAEVAARLVERLRDERAFWTPWPVASVPHDDVTFSRRSRIWGLRFIWRGPVSVNTNWLLAHGLRRHGYDDVADELAARTCELVARHGFNEFYDPLGGAPVGASDFGWATLVTDLGSR
jgi:glycogen debranching enzyme